ncbi:ammonium transporter, Amt family [Desulfosarcina sp. BuS5]|nr:ammonium transporter, Amt family [Desulfosarcina sp. BuS5]
MQPAGAILLGALSSILCYYALQAKIKFGYDDSLDYFGIHGISSGLVVLLLFFFIRPSWMRSAAEAAGGKWSAVDQFLIQLQGIGATIALAAVGTLVIYFIVEKSVGFRIDEQKEMEGLDKSLHGEHGYGLVHSDLVG